MGRTLLLGTDGASWYEWLKDNRKGRDLVVLDPADAHYGPAGRMWLIKGEKPAYSTFFGSIDPQRAPHILTAALAEFLDHASPDVLVQLFAYRPTPMLKQVAELLAFLMRPEQILIESKTAIARNGWPIGPEEIELPTGLPPVVVEAQRKAQWLKLIERCQRHEIPLHQCAIQGARLHSGVQLDELARHRAGLDNALHAEVCGSTLLIVTDGNLDEDVISRALDVTHVPRAQISHPRDYNDMLCAFVRTNGDEFGYGMIERIDFAEGVIHARADAVPPVPVPILRLGSLRVDKDGRERGELKPWQA